MTCLPIKFIFEDNHLLVVEKPVNTPSQADISRDPDLLTLLKEDLKIRYQKPGNVYLGLVHRLDRPVGGVMVFAKTSKAAARLSAQIRNREFQKYYLAVVHGKLINKEGQLQHYLIKDSLLNKVLAFSEPRSKAKEAILNYQVIEESAEFSLLRISLHTGRSHQIRVQFAAIGHSLYGDQKYGGGLNKIGQQIALWSTEIRCLHPTKDEEMVFNSKPPEVVPWSWFKIRT